jgi:hypothetical protein
MKLLKISWVSATSNIKDYAADREHKIKNCIVSLLFTKTSLIDLLNQTNFPQAETKRELRIEIIQFRDSQREWFYKCKFWFDSNLLPNQNNLVSCTIKTDYLASSIK